MCGKYVWLVIHSCKGVPVTDRAKTRTGLGGATSERGMDTIRDKFTAGRRDMIDAFAALSTLAHRAGADPEKITELHGQFFDGNVAVKQAFCAVQLLPAEKP